MNISWTEIPVKDMERAMAFYGAVFQCTLEINIPQPPMAFLPFNKEKPGSSGALIHMPDFYNPAGENGMMVYFEADEIDDVLPLVEANGGTVIIPKRKISDEHGHMAVFMDTEGNRLAFYQNPK